MATIQTTYSDEDLVELFTRLGFKRGGDTPPPVQQLTPDQLKSMLDELGYVPGPHTENPTNPPATGGNQTRAMTATQKIFNDFNVKNDGSPTTDALQKAINKLMKEGENIIFPAGEYQVNDTIEFASDEPGVRVLVQGFNAKIEGRLGDQPWNVSNDAPDDEQWKQLRDHAYKPIFNFSRSPHEWNMKVEGFNIKSNNRGVICLQTEGITQSSFRDMTLAGWVCGRYEGWTCTYDNIVHKSAYIGGWWYSGSRGLNSNANVISNCRTYGAKWGYNKHQVVPFSHFIVEGGGNELVGRNTHEGNASRYQIWVGLERNAAYEIVLGPIHTEIQEWAALEKGQICTIGMMEQRHRLILNEMPRYGLRSFKDRLGNIIVNAKVTGDKDHSMPRKWEGVGRNVTVYAVNEHGAWHGQESADKWLEHLGVSNARIVMNAKLYTHS